MKFFCIFLVLAGCVSCVKKEETLFKKLPSSHTGVNFINAIHENDSVNAFTNQYLFNGGGVAIADFNNDELPDLLFTANLVSCELYLNKGELQFENITNVSGIRTATWVNGVTVVDINQDGLKDIYISAGNFHHPLESVNLLFVHQGSKDGIPKFKELAKEYGLTVNAYSVQASFFDYDLDGDLDMYQLTNGFLESRSNNTPRPKQVKGESITIDRLYRNEGMNSAGHPYFTDVTLEANLLIEGYGLGLAVADINDDGWPDVYAANDFLSNDLVWINNRNGTFSNHAAQYLKHQSFNSMGIDIADYNNDGLQDIFVVDMEPEDNYRKKMMSTGPNYEKHILGIRQGYELQFVRNVLQVNNGKLPDGSISFSDVSQLAGVHQTDWSWCPLLADFDNDGWRDLFITNGFRRDITDLDFVVYNYNQGMFGDKNQQLKDFKLKYKEVPEIKLKNYAYKNKGDLTFANVSTVWGLDDLSYSNGAAFDDLDNDGDLDLIVNNIDSEAFIYENQSQQKASGHYLKIKLVGPTGNRDALGAKIKLYTKKGLQFHEHRNTRGYISSMEDIIHFGLGDQQYIDSVKIIWPNGRVCQQTNVKSDTLLVLQYSHSVEKPDSIKRQSTLLTKVTQSRGIDYLHQETDFVDFDINRLIPHKHSQYGPSVATGDVNGDQRDDFFVGGSKDFPGHFFLQQRNGKFRKEEFSEHIRHEDVGSLLFDFDLDNDLDLYVVSGSVEYYKGVKEFQDRLYENNGQGLFTPRADLLPKMHANGSCVKAADFDADGDLDLFVGGHVVPGQYPRPDRSYLLENSNGKFIDVTQKIAPGLDSIGLVMDALWTDVDNDGSIDLIIVGEWMPITFFKNEMGKFKDITPSTGLASFSGWWNSISSGDFDHDGDIDYVCGNLGSNSEYKVSVDEPMKLFVKDMDSNGSLDPILTYYRKGLTGRREPQVAYARDHLISQLPFIKGQFTNYGDYAKAPWSEIFPEEKLKGSQIFQATCLQTSYIENKGAGRFLMNALPIQAQIAPVFAMSIMDINADGDLDIIGVNNFYGADVKMGRYDAGIGLALIGDGEGHFRSIEPQQSGFLVSGDAKALSVITDHEGNGLVIASQNRDSLKVFSVPGRYRSISLKPGDLKADITYKNGRKEIQEFYYGSSFLSQTSRKIHFTDEPEKIVIKDYQGRVRTIFP